MTTGVSQIGFFYVNGVANTDEYGSNITNDIQTIIQESKNFESDKVFVAFHHNDSAPLERLMIEVGVGIAGVAAAGYAFDKESKDQGTFASRAIGFLGLCGIIGAFADYAKMQSDKNIIAKDFAKRVSKFLDEDDQNVANLILHSQGADIGYRSLELLSEYKERIRTITLGPMTTIPKDMCAQVTNYKFTNDWVSNYLAFLFEQCRKSSDQKERKIIPIKKEGILAHGMSGYLAEKIVQENLLSSLCRLSS